MLPDPTERNVNPLLFQTGIRTVKKLVLTLTIQYEDITVVKTAQVLASTSGQDLPFHLKTAELPKFTETMSLASPHYPNSGSSSRCHPTHEFHPR